VSTTWVRRRFFFCLRAAGDELCLSCSIFWQFFTQSSCVKASLASLSHQVTHHRYPAIRSHTSDLTALQQGLQNKALWCTLLPPTMEKRFSTEKPRSDDGDNIGVGEVLNASGHKQELERHFSLLSICSIGITTGNVWAALGGSIVS
jgi:hypothetical protein